VSVISSAKTETFKTNKKNTAVAIKVDLYIFIATLRFFYCLSIWKIVPSPSPRPSYVLAARDEGLPYLLLSLFYY